MAGRQQNAGMRWARFLYRMQSLLILFLGSSLLFTQGCLPLFVAAGAGAGYLAADKKAARKVDRFMQELGRSISTSARRIAGSRQTEKRYKYRRGSGTAVRLQKTSVTPTRVNSGDTVTGIMIYGVLGAPGKGLVVSEKRELWFGGKRLSILQNESLTRKNGTWKSRLVFKVPDSAAKGTYEVRQQVSYRGKTRSSTKKFTVL